MNSHLRLDAPLLTTALAAAPWAGFWPLAGAAVACVGVHAWAILDPRSQLDGPVIWRLGADAAALALTFDDGPGEATPAILDRLARSGMHATFFVIGENARRHPDLLRRIAGEGHAVGLHSLGHDRRFPLRGPAALVRDLEENRRILADLLGAPPLPLLRPPMGLVSPTVGVAARRCGLHLVTWTASGRDGGATTPTRILARLERGLRPGAILVLHDGAEPGRTRDVAPTLAALDVLLPRLHEAGSPSRALTVVDGAVRLAP